MPLVAPVLRQSLSSQRLGDRAVPSLVGLVIFSAAVLAATIQTPEGYPPQSEPLAESPAVTDQWAPESARLLQAHQGLNGLGLLHSSPTRD